MSININKRPAINLSYKTDSIILINNREMFEPIDYNVGKVIKVFVLEHTMDLDLYNTLLSKSHIDKFDYMIHFDDILNNTKENIELKGIIWHFINDLYEGAKVEYVSLSGITKKYPVDRIAQFLNPEYMVLNY